VSDARPQDDHWPLGDLTACVSRRSHAHDLRPGFVYRDDPIDARDSGWCLLVGDESEAETDDPANILLQRLGLLVDRWPELRPVLDAEPQPGSWAWDPATERYLPIGD
jgi:hypothetical protein